MLPVGLPAWLTSALVAALVAGALLFVLLWKGRHASARRARRWIGTALLTLGSTIVGLLVAEGAVRIVFRSVTTTVDNSGYFARRWRAREPLRVNALGFREREIAPKADGGRYRIAVIGDSFTFGQGIPEEDRLTNVLERRLNAERAPGDAAGFEVLNFGRPGAETVDHIRILEESVLGVEPDFVLLQWFVNDVEGRDKSGRPVHLRLVPSDRLSGWLHRHSALYHLALRQWRDLQERLGVAGSYDDYMRARFGDGRGEESRRAREELLTFIDTVREAGVPVGMVVWPRLSADDRPGSGLGFLLDRVLELCAEAGVRCVDLRTAFADIRPQTKLWANRLDPHPGRPANELAARAVLDCFETTWRASAEAVPAAQEGCSEPSS